MPLPTVGLVGGIVYELSVRTSGRYVHPSVNIYFAWHDFCLLSGRVGDFKEACHKYLSCKWQRIAYLNCVTNCWGHLSSARICPSSVGVLSQFCYVYLYHHFLPEKLMSFLVIVLQITVITRTGATNKVAALQLRRTS